MGITDTLTGGTALVIDHSHSIAISDCFAFFLLTESDAFPTLTSRAFVRFPFVSTHVLIIIVNTFSRSYRLVIRIISELHF